MNYTPTHHLQARIAQLESDRKKLETVIIKDVRVISENIKHPAPYIRATVAELASDRSFFSDLISIIIQFGTSYVANKFGRSVAKSNFLSELLGASEKSDENGPKILDLLKNLFKSKNEPGREGDRDQKNS